uniref:Sugar phosphate exchanger 3 n=1 Tax=Poecilia latipinna TaxID=48699 RepID=A0A3B3UB82_9TELE
MPPSCFGCLSQYTHHHLVVFLLTFFSYVLLHASRKTFSNVKVSISAQWTPSAHNDSVPAFCPVETWEDNHLFADEKQATLFLGALDSIFLFSYAVVSRMKAKQKMSGECRQPHGQRFKRLPSLWVLNGLLQSAVWPCVVAVMGNWFGKAGLRPNLFTLLSSASSGTYAFLVTSVVQFAGGVVVFFGLLTSPKEVGKSRKKHERFPVETDTDSHRPLMSDEEEDNEQQVETYSQQCRTDQPPEEPEDEPPHAIGFFQAFCLPGVLLYSLAYACLKLVNYSFFFWLPFYLSNNYGWKEAEADRLSVWYDVGGIVGGTLQGLISDFMGKRAPVLVFSLVMAMGSLVGYSRSPNDKVINAVILAITGFFIGGPSNMISSAISADLGRQDILRGSQEALATVTGIVDGTGSIGAAVGQYLVSLIESKLGWMSVFYFFVVMTGGSVVFIVPLLVRELRDMWRERQALRHQL